VERFVPDGRAQFRTFATARIQGAVLNGLSRLTERSHQAAVRRRLAAERTSSLVPHALALEPTDRLLGDLGDIGVSVAISLILEGSGMGEERRDGMPHEVYGRVELRQLHRQVWTMVERLPERERNVIEMHYRDARRFEEIARVLRLTKGRISQLHRQAVQRLRALVSRAETCDVSW
jgi:RNA polymerase sigma factor for flagellar operon FliA